MMPRLSLFKKKYLDKKAKLFFCLVFAAATAHAQTDTTVSGNKKPPQVPVFQLGEVEVKERKNKDIGTTISAEKVEAFYKTDVSNALNLLPGVNLSAVGPRNEAMVYVRGFDLRQVPLLIDGVPVYVPYDGYADLARFTSFDLSEINVSKGYTSVLYGPNALGGAINLVGRKPTKPLEIASASGWMTGGYRTNINIGAKLGKFYVQAGVSRLKRDYFPLSKGFTATKTEDGGHRDNSYSEDDKYSIKIGYSPKGKSEYALSYIYQHGKKGTPVYTGSDTKNSQYTSPRYWQWPYWDKQSLYFISNTHIDSSQYIKTRLYYDVFRNQLNSYDNASYSTFTKGYAFQSFYDDYTLGGILEYGKNFWSGKDMFKATLQYKQDVHRENNLGEPVRTMSDRTVTAGVENELKINNKLFLRTGLSYNFRGSITAQNYNSSTKTVTDFPVNNNSAFNIQGELVYNLHAKHSLNISVARKTRFATVKDRYSYRLGTAVPNPSLSSEYTVNYELGYKANPVERLHLEAALFYSHINNTIQSVNNVQYDASKSVWLSQLQNTGESEFVGGELAAEYEFSPSVTMGANYTYIERHNLSNPTVYFTDVPRHKLFSYLQYKLKDKFYWQGNIEYNSQRYSTSYGTTEGAFALLNTKASVKIWCYFSTEAGINNILDRNYALVEGYPEPGRNYFVNLVYKY